MKFLATPLIFAVSFCTFNGTAVPYIHVYV